MYLEGTHLEWALPLGTPTGQSTAVRKPTGGPSVLQDVRMGFGRDESVQGLPVSTIGRISLKMRITFLDSSVDATGTSDSRCQEDLLALVQCASRI
jgi:hypothetical protein